MIFCLNRIRYILLQYPEDACLKNFVVVNEAFQVAAMIEKLPSTWNDFKNYLKRKHKEMNLEVLVIRLKIEEDNKKSRKEVA